MEVLSHSGFMQHISGHKDGCGPNYTQCPGQNLYEKLSGLRTSAKQNISEGCSSISTSDDIFKNRTLKIIPNPAEDKISIENDENDKDIQQFKIIDITGRLICTPTTLSKGINVSTLEPGTYTLLAVTKSGLKAGKFIKI